MINDLRTIRIDQIEWCDRGSIMHGRRALFFMAQNCFRFTARPRRRAQMGTLRVCWFLRGWMEIRLALNCCATGLYSTTCPCSRGWIDQTL